MATKFDVNGIPSEYFNRHIIPLLNEHGYTVFDQMQESQRVVSFSVQGDDPENGIPRVFGYVADSMDELVREYPHGEFSVCLVDLRSVKVSEE